MTQYFWPESFVINDIVRKLVDAGHTVTVFTGKPNYPEGKLFAGYKFWGVNREKYYGVDVVRVPLIPRGKKSGRRLVLNYLSFVLFGSLLAPFIFFKKKIDVIFVYSPSPITMVIPAIVIKALKRKKLYLWVQDLWPESLSATGFVKNKYILRLVEWLVKWIYLNCDKLLIQSEAFREPISRLTEPDKIIYYPNSVESTDLNIEEISPGKYKNTPLNNIGKKFSIVFAGNIGTAQSIETIIAAASEISNQGFEIDFFLVGNGSQLAWAQDEVQRLQLQNVYFPGRFPMSDMPYILSRADVLLVSLKNKPIFSYTIPFKVQGYLATGKPIIASMNGEGARIIASEAKAGIACSAEDVNELADAVIRIFNMTKEQRSELGENGKSYFKKYFDMDVLLNRLVEILKT